MDDLSGLDWSSKPNGSQPKAPMMSNPAYPSLRPSPSPFSSGRSTPLSAQASAASASKPPPGKPAHDSFSNLVNFGSAKASQNLSLADRQAQLEEEKRKKEAEKRKQTEAQFGNGQGWDALGARQFTPSPAAQLSSMGNNSQAANDDDDLFAAFNKDTKVDKASHYPPPDSQRSTPSNAAPLDLGNPSAWGSSGTANGTLGVEDDDPFGLNELKPGRAPVTSKQEDAGSDDDFLGDLGRPVHEVRQKKPMSVLEPGLPIEDNDSSSSDDEEPQERVPKVNKDPFDLAVAQLVDYGFSAEDATRALAESGSGYNAQAAANWLLDDAHRKSKAAAEGKPLPPRPSQPGRRDSRSPVKGEPDLAKSAAAMGNSLFKTANSLWKTGQKRVQQAVADFNQEGERDLNQPKWMRDAQQEQTHPRPRKADTQATDEAMMLEAGGRPQAGRSRSGQPRETQLPARPSRDAGQAQQPASRSSPAPRWQQQTAPPPIASDTRSRLNRLAAEDDNFSTYSSPNRRSRTPQQAAPKASKPEPEHDLLFNTKAPAASPQLPHRPAQNHSTRPAQSAKRPSPSPRPTPSPARQIPPVSAAALQNSTKHRLEGTAHYKRGDYAAAHSSYTTSLSGLPDTHPLIVVILTNRAMTALKTGEPKQAVSDADSALKLIGPGRGQGETVAVKTENDQDESRDMKELYGKALTRKAEALEQMEKWADAGTVWQQCVHDGVGGAAAIKGRQRCQNALAPKPKAAAKPAAKPRPKPSARNDLAPQKSSEAVTRLREAHQAAAKEDDEKFALSEKVDAKVSAWRDGKRDNLRALLSSMDNVLWENSGWKTVGLHELVMANKVKIVYMKAIAKTHPDKLPQDATTEVRLIAGLVFSTINEAWDKFKAENGL